MQNLTHFARNTLSFIQYTHRLLAGRHISGCQKSDGQLRLNVWFHTAAEILQVFLRGLHGKYLNSVYTSNVV